MNSLFIKIIKLTVFCCLSYLPQMAQETADLSKLRTEIEAEPNNLEKHEEYLKAAGFAKWNAPDDPDFIAFYENLIKKNPESAVAVFALGHAYWSKESPKATPYLLKAVELDPKFAKAYFELWIDKERWGDEKGAVAYIKKATEAAPDNPDYAFYFANTHADSDLKEYTSLSLKVAKDFPESERGAQSLYWLASRTKDLPLKYQYFELLKKSYPVGKFNWSSSGMSIYFNTLLENDAKKALELANSLLPEFSDNERNSTTWKSNVELAQNVSKAEALLKEGKGKEALAILEAIPLRRGGPGEFLLLLKSKTLDAAGKTKEAYQSLLKAYAKEPVGKVENQLQTYAQKLGKNEAIVKQEVEYIRDTTARQAPNFNLYNYFTQKNSSLADYKGKVVLLTYWFPGCGPCRAEFPHFENAIKSFKGRKDFAYIGINISPVQDDYVLPFMKGSGYSFTPLRDNEDWVKGPLDNRNAAPVNFLIDGEGRIIFSNFRTHADNEATLETMISSLLH